MTKRGQSHQIAIILWLTIDLACIYKEIVYGISSKKPCCWFIWNIYNANIDIWNIYNANIDKSKGTSTCSKWTWSALHGHSCDSLTCTHILTFGIKQGQTVHKTATERERWWTDNQTNRHMRQTKSKNRGEGEANERHNTRKIRCSDHNFHVEA